MSCDVGQPGAGDHTQPPYSPLPLSQQEKLSRSEGVCEVICLALCLGHKWEVASDKTTYHLFTQHLLGTKCAPTGTWSFTTPRGNAPLCSFHGGKGRDPGGPLGAYVLKPRFPCRQPGSESVFTTIVLSAGSEHLRFSTVSMSAGADEPRNWQQEKAVFKENITTLYSYLERFWGQTSDKV